MKPFDLAAFKAGAIAMTRNGLEARYIGEIISPTPVIYAILVNGVDAEIALAAGVSGLREENKRRGDDLISMKSVAKTWHFLSYVHGEERVCTNMYDDLSKLEEKVARNSWLKDADTIFHTLEIEE